MEEQPAPPKVTALIVSYNCVTALRRCLAALEASRGREALEILVVDNGSLDDCPRVDAEFPSVTILRLPRHFGRTKALNIGIRTAAGEYLFFLDPRVEVPPEAVGALATRLDNDGSAVAVCPLLVDAAGEPVEPPRRLPKPEELSAEWRSGECAPPPPLALDQDEVAVEMPSQAAIMARKLFVRGMNYFDERYGEFGAHLELCFQIRFAGKKTLLLPAVRALLHPPDPTSLPPSASARGLLSADFAHGAAVYTSKRRGAVTGFAFRLSTLCSALGSFLSSLVRFRDVGFHFARFSALASGQKVDGSQHAL